MPFDEEADARVRHIADALRIPVDALLSSRAGPVAATAELLRLWTRIADPAARERILIAARREATFASGADEAAG